MSVDTSILSMDHIQFAIQTVEDNANRTKSTSTSATISILNNDQEEEAWLDSLVLEVQDWNTVEYRVMIAQHHPDYLGGGTGEYFFPLETGAWDRQ